MKISDTSKTELVEIFSKALDRGLCRFATMGGIHACQVAVFKHSGELEGHDRVKLRGGVNSAENLANSFEKLVGTSGEDAGDQIVSYVCTQLA